MLEILFPSNIKCMLCSREIYDDSHFGLCSQCYDKIAFTWDFTCCRLCGRPIYKFSDYSICNECARHPRDFTCGYSCSIYEGLSEKIMLDFKYKDKSYLHKLVADIMISKIISENIDFDYILYVPSHFTRKLIRGFNQTELVAKEIAYRLDKEILNDFLIRKRRTKRLKKLSRYEREEELSQAFKINKNISIGPGSILLIDDIFTTGSTLNTCTRLLLENGVSSVKIITFAVKCNYDYNVYK